MFITRCILSGRAQQARLWLAFRGRTQFFLFIIHLYWMKAETQVKAPESNTALHYSPGCNPTWKWNWAKKANDYKNNHVPFLNLCQWITHLIKTAFNPGPSVSLANYLAFKVPINFIPWTWECSHYFRLWCFLVVPCQGSRQKKRRGRRGLIFNLGIVKV